MHRHKDVPRLFRAGGLAPATEAPLHLQPVPPWSPLPLWAEQGDVGVSREMRVFRSQVTCPCWGQAAVSHIPSSLQQRASPRAWGLGLCLCCCFSADFSPIFLVVSVLAVWSLFPSFLPAFPIGSSGAARCQPQRLLHGSALTESRHRQGWAAASLGGPGTSVTSATRSPGAPPMGGKPLPAPGMAAVLREGMMLPAQGWHRAWGRNLSGSLWGRMAAEGRFGVTVRWMLCWELGLPSSSHACSCDTESCPFPIPRSAQVTRGGCGCYSALKRAEQGFEGCKMCLFEVSPIPQEMAVAVMRRHRAAGCAPSPLSRERALELQPLGTSASAYPDLGLW